MEDDEFSVSPQNEQQHSQASGKSMKAIYQHLQGQQEHKSKKIKKQEKAKGKLKKEEKIKEKPKKAAQVQEVTQQKVKGDPTCKYVKNKDLQSNLKHNALSGVLTIFNLIKKTQNQRKTD